MMKPNIVFFFSDQQRWDTLGCNGQPLDITPCLDQFASQDATNFSNCFTPQPVCGPARAMLQTGLYPTQTGCYRNAIPLPLDQKTLATSMRDAGYNVAYVGKWHLASGEDGPHYETEPVPLERRGGYSGYWRAADVLEFTSHGYGGYIYDESGNKLEFNGYRTDFITDQAIHFIENYDSDKPFFLFLSHIEPHHQNDRGNYEGPDGSKERFADFIPPMDLPAGCGDWEEFFPDYLGCCNALDTNFGRIIRALKNRDLYDDSMVIYTSDHGCHFRTHTEEIAPGGYDDYKRNSFEGTIHVPLLIKGPGFTGGCLQEKVVSLIDLPKTLMTAAGCEIGKEIQGRALQEVAREDWEEMVYIQISESFVGRAVRSPRYKYVVHAPDKHPWNDSGSSVYTEKYLFDLQEDPLEKNNLLGNFDYEHIRCMLKERLIQFALEAGEGYIQID